MQKTFSAKKFIILVILLAAPGFLYYLLQKNGKNRYKPLPALGPKRVAKTFHIKHGKHIPDTVYHHISDFKLINQKGDTVYFTKDTARIAVVNFFFTRCPGFCKDMNAEMARVVEVYKNNRFLRFFSITIDPKYDNPTILSQYAKQYNARPGKWDFLTGNEQMIHRLAKDDFLVDAFPDTTRVNNFIHGPLFILVDPKQHIRGYYDSGNRGQVRQTDR